MIRIEIKRPDVFSTTVRPSTTPGSRQFEPFERKYQVGYILLTLPNGEPDDVPTKLELPISDGDQPLAAGWYTVSAGSFYVDKYRRLTLGRLKLQTVSPVAQARAA